MTGSSIQKNTKVCLIFASTNVMKKQGCGRLDSLFLNKTLKSLFCRYSAAAAKLQVEFIRTQSYEVYFVLSITARL